jgi:hypothetical protein
MHPNAQKCWWQNSMVLMLLTMKKKKKKWGKSILFSNVLHDCAITQPQQQPLLFPPQKRPTPVPQSSYLEAYQVPHAISAKTQS